MKSKKWKKKNIKNLNKTFTTVINRKPDSIWRQLKKKPTKITDPSKLRAQSYRIGHFNTYNFVWTSILTVIVK